MTKKKKRKKERDETFQNLVNELERAVESGSWLVAVFSMNGNQVRLFRKTGGEPGFPVDDFPTAVDLLDDDLRKEREKVEDMDAAPVIGKKA